MGLRNGLFLWTVFFAVIRSNRPFASARNQRASRHGQHLGLCKFGQEVTEPYVSGVVVISLVPDHALFKLTDGKRGLDDLESVFERRCSGNAAGNDRGHCAVDHGIDRQIVGRHDNGRFRSPRHIAETSLRQTDQIAAKPGFDMINLAEIVKTHAIEQMLVRRVADEDIVV